MASNRIRALALGAILAIAPLAVGPTVSVANAAATKADARAMIDAAVKAATASPEFKAAAEEGVAAQKALDALPADAPAATKAAAQAKVNAAKAKQTKILAEAVASAVKAAIAAGVAPGEASAALAEAAAAGVVPANVALAAAGLVNATASTNGSGAPNLINPPTAAGGAGGGGTGATFDPCAGVIATYCG